MNRPYTPEEVAALQRPAVQSAVDLINHELIRGMRTHRVKRPLVDDVTALLRMSGWNVAVVDVPVGTDCPLLRLTPATTDSDADRLRATIVAELQRTYTPGTT